MGRPTKLTGDVQDAICKRIEQGNYPEVAAQCEGIGARTYYEWMAKGDAGEQPYAQFSQAVTRARARAEAELLAEIRAQATPTREGAAEDWRARAWLLERTRRDRYGVKVEVVAMERAQNDLLDRLRETLDQSTYQTVLRALVGEAGEAEAPGEPVH